MMNVDEIMITSGGKWRVRLVHCTMESQKLKIKRIEKIPKAVPTKMTKELVFVPVDVACIMYFVHLRIYIFYSVLFHCLSMCTIGLMCITHDSIVSGNNY